MIMTKNSNSASRSAPVQSEHQTQQVDHICDHNCVDNQTDSPYYQVGSDHKRDHKLLKNKNNPYHDTGIQPDSKNYTFRHTGSDTGRKSRPNLLFIGQEYRNRQTYKFIIKSAFATFWCTVAKISVLVAVVVIPLTLYLEGMI